LSYPERRSFADFCHHSAVFVAEEAGHRNLRVPPQIGLEVRTACARGRDLDENFSRSRLGNIDLRKLDASRFF
jgi:hypothetical protein